MTAVAGVVLDLDGVIVHSEHLWERAWHAAAVRRDTAWTARDTSTVQGMSAPEWARYLAERVAAPEEAEELRTECVTAVVTAVVDGDAPLLPGAEALVRELSARVPVGLASSAARPVIEAVLRTYGLGEHFTSTVSSEEVDRGKPYPDVYLAARHHIGIPAERGLAVEDSGNGIRAAHAAGLEVVAVPNPDYPPSPEALDFAEHTATDLREALTLALEQRGGAPMNRPATPGRPFPGQRSPGRYSRTESRQ